MVSFLGQNVLGNDFPPAPRKLEKDLLVRADQKGGPCFLNASNVVKHLTVIYGEDAESGKRYHGRKVGPQHRWVCSGWEIGGSCVRDYIEEH